MINYIKVWFGSLLSPENKVILINRLKSFAWRVGGQMSLEAVNLVATNIGLFHLNIGVQIILGVALSEITKLINTKLTEKAKLGSVAGNKVV